MFIEVPFRMALMVFCDVNSYDPDGVAEFLRRHGPSTGISFNKHVPTLGMVYDDPDLELLSAIASIVYEPDLYVDVAGEAYSNDGPHLLVGYNPDTLPQSLREALAMFPEVTLADHWEGYRGISLYVPYLHQFESCPPLGGYYTEEKPDPPEFMFCLMALIRAAIRFDHTPAGTTMH